MICFRFFPKCSAFQAIYLVALPMKFALVTAGLIVLSFVDLLIVIIRGSSTLDTWRNWRNEAAGDVFYPLISRRGVGRLIEVSSNLYSFRGRIFSATFTCQFSGDLPPQKKRCGCRSPVSVFFKTNKLKYHRIKIEGR